MDEDLALPERSSSQEVQRRVVKAAVQGPFDEAAERLEESAGVSMPKRCAEHIVEDFWAFHVRAEQERLHPPGRWRPLEASA